MLGALLIGVGGAHASTTPIGFGDLPSAVTDQDGTTHVVWLESHGSATDTVAYCRIPRGTTTCADLKHLTPTCQKDVPAASHHRVAGGQLDGDAPKVAITPFGDVYVMADGLCPWTANTKKDPWASYVAILRQLVFHSEDDGDTFGKSEEGQAHVDGFRKSMDPDQGLTLASSGVLDVADSRIVSVEEGGGVDIGGGIYVLGPQDQLSVHDPDPPTTEKMQAGRLA